MRWRTRTSFLKAGMMKGRLSMAVLAQHLSISARAKGPSLSEVT